MIQVPVTPLKRHAPHTELQSSSGGSLIARARTARTPPASRRCLARHSARGL